MADFSGEYRVYVYDRGQAEALQAKYVAHLYADTTIELIELDGFGFYQKKKPGPTSKYSTPEEKEEATRARNRRSQAALRARREKAKSDAEAAKDAQPAPLTAKSDPALMWVA